MGTASLIFTALVVGGVAFLAGRRSRRIDVDPSARTAERPTSIFVERVEPSFRPIRICIRCGRKIVKRLESDEMVIRIEGQTVMYFHGECTDETGEPLP